MKGYKAFNKGLVCLNKQYSENTVFEEEKAKICHSGMHFCVNPFDVLEYYPLVNDDGEFSEFAEVEALADCDTDDDKKFTTTKLKIGAKRSFTGFVKACVDFVIEKTKVELSGENIISNAERATKIGSSGDSAQIGSSGYYAKIVSTGEDSVICCAGIDSKVKAKKGSWITLSEWEYSDEKRRYVPVCVKTEFVDGEKIKENTFYRLETGEFTEVKE